MSTAQDPIRTTSATSILQAPSEDSSVEGSTEAPIPRYEPRNCCGRSDQSVYFAGKLDGIRHEDVEQWIRRLTTLPFEHVIKKQHKSYGHVHFASREAAGRFFFAHRERAYEGPAGGTVKFSEATNYKSNEKIAYVVNEPRKRQRVNSDSQQTNKHTPPYALYEYEGSYILYVCASGVSRKEQVRLDVAKDCRTLTISAEFEIICTGDKIVGLLPSEIHFQVLLPNEIDCELPAKVEFKDGVLSIGLQTSTRRLRVV